MFNKNLVLNNGKEIPQLGLGTWFIDDSKVADVIVSAIKLGYRHIDTAEAYGNERGVGIGIKKSGIKREKIFLQTKLAAEIKTYDEAKIAIEESLAKLDVDYIDLMIIHSPQPWSNFRDGNHYKDGNLNAWKALTEYYKLGKIKAIGVSNFEKEDIENIINNSDVKPMVNQILCHVSNTDFDLIKYCKDNNIVVEAYSPIGHGELLNNPQLKLIANKYHVTVSQLCIRYTIQLGLVSLPKASSLNHLKENIDVDFTISEDDMDILCKIDKIHSYGEFDIFPCYREQVNFKK